MERLLHAPEGVRDLYGSECEKKQYLQRQIQTVFKSFGYQSIETPTFEYFDVFGREVGTTPSGELYKFFDREGNTLALRPDFTPSIARAVSTYYTNEQMPVRLCYQGSVFQNGTSYRGRLRETTQMGVEFLNEDSAAADAEVIAMAAQVMQKSGLSKFQISVGHVDYFRALAEEARLSKEQEEELRKLISIKNYFGAQELLERLAVRRDLGQALGMLPQMFGGREILDKARALTRNPRALAAIGRLEAIWKILCSYGCEKYVAFDFGLVSKYQYYTGIIFQGYTYGTGEAVATGGRYDRLLEHFNKKAPAIGFTIVMDQLMNALERQGLQPVLPKSKTMILYVDFLEETAVRLAVRHRREGMEVACVRFARGQVLDDYKAYGKRADFGGIVYLQGEGEAFAISLLDDSVKQIPFPED